MKEPNMIIKGIDSNKMISFELTDKETSYLPSFAFDIEINNNDFSSKVNQMWFELKKVELFSSKLKSIITTSNEEPILETMSPKEFILKIEKIDELGHYALKYEISKNSYIQSKLVKNEVKSAFEITQSEVDKIINYFNLILE